MPIQPTLPDQQGRQIPVAHRAVGVWRNPTVPYGGINVMEKLFHPDPPAPLFKTYFSLLLAMAKWRGMPNASVRSFAIIACLEARSIE